MRPPFTYYGGKNRMLEHILPLIPKHKIYVEPFAGSATVFFGKSPSPVEVLNDLNGNLAAFYRTAKTDFANLKTLIETTIHCENTFKKAKAVFKGKEVATDLEKAWSVWILGQMSFGGDFGSSFSYAVNHNDCGNPSKGTCNARNAFKHYAGRLDAVTVLERDAVKVLEKYNRPEVFTYIDPPYISASQGHYRGYMETNYRALLDLLEKFKGKFILSSYPSEVLEEYTDRNNWNQKEYGQRLGVKVGARKVEVLTWNYDKELTLF